jgi:hypothetical protein
VYPAPAQPALDVQIASVSTSIAFEVTNVRIDAFRFIFLACSFTNACPIFRDCIVDASLAFIFVCRFANAFPIFRASFIEFSLTFIPEMWMWMWMSGLM